MDPSDDRKLRLEQESLQLEVEKQRFEEQKFAAESEARLEALMKLRAERQKAELEIEDLKVPYRKRPTYRTALFQGIALVIAVASGLVSIGSLKSLFDTYVANQEKAAAINRQATAETAEKDAIAQAKNATDERNKVLGELGPLQDKLAGLQAQVSKATTDAELAPVTEILSSLGEKKNGSDAVEEKRLLQALITKDAEINKVRVAYLQTFALRDSEPMGVRLAVLRVLYERAQAVVPSNGFELKDIRQQFISLATTSKNGAANEYSWDALGDFLGKEASNFICQQYDEQTLRTAAFSQNRTKMAAYIFRKVPSEGCPRAAWDYLDPLAGMRSIFPDSEHFDFNFPSEVALVRIYPTSKKVDGASGALGALVSTEGQTYFFNSTIMDYDAQGRCPLCTEALFRDSDSKIKQWFDDNKDLVVLLNEPGLTKLRTCKPEILDEFRQNRYVGKPTIQNFCPANLLR